MRMPDASAAVVAETRVLGLGIDPMTTTIGFGHSRLVAMPKSCGLLIFAEDAAAVKAWRDLLPDVNIQCIVQSRKEKPNE